MKLKKFLSLALVLSLGVLLSLGLASCDEGESTTTTTHTHSFSGEYKSDSTGHWQLCSCGEKGSVLAHTFGEYTIVKDATEESAGSKTRTCSVCNYTETETIAKLDHTHSYGEWSVTTAPTESTKGLLSRTCSKDSTHSETAELPVLTDTSYVVTTTKAATCEEKGTKTYTLSKDGQELIVATAEISALGHSYGEWSVTTTPTESTKGELTRKCSVCDDTETAELPILNDTDYSIDVVASTTDVKGSLTYKYLKDSKTINVVSFDVYKTIEQAFPDADLSFNTNYSETLVLDGKGLMIIESWVDAWYSNNITIKGIIFKNGATFSAKSANIASDITITIENCIFYACDQTKIDTSKQYNNISNSGAGLCLDVETSDSSYVAVVINNNKFIGENNKTLDRNGYKDWTYGGETQGVGSWTGSKSRGHAIAINAIRDGGSAKSVVISNNVIDGIRGNAIQLYKFNYTITVKNNIINSWGNNSVTSNDLKDDAAIRGEVDTNGSLILENNYFGLDETVKTVTINNKSEKVGLYHVNVNNYTGNTSGSREKGLY